MKLVKSILCVLSVFAIALAFSACGGDTDNAEKTGKEYTSAYVCPMHCEGSGSDKAGTCPVCKMDYVMNENHKSDGHKHDADAEHKHEGGDGDGHEGHDHGEGDHDGHNH